MYFAHSGDRWEPLAEHLLDVAERARRFASPFGAGEEAHLAGLLHDLGKYSDLFTLRLEGKAHHLDHWSIGAWAALMSFRDLGVAAALAVQGHHIGLQVAEKDSLASLNPGRLAERHPLNLKLTDADWQGLLARLRADGLTIQPLSDSLYSHSSPQAAAMLDVRMLFSALVDADYLETEAHFRRREDGEKRHRPEGPPLRAAEALALLKAQVENVARESRATPTVKALRADLLRACLEAGEWPRGLFTLSAPTGAGKTLAMLAFALRHAEKHHLRRVVVAIPFLTILEQTVGIYRGLFQATWGPDYVLEHHSLAGRGGRTKRDEGEPDPQDEAGRRADWLRENWDAPLVVTTSVQLLESLFANRPSACRKLHRLADSVILFDEVQTLPPALAVPTLAALSRLAERYGCSVVFATATQPAFDSLDSKVRQWAPAGWTPNEIAPPSLNLFGRVKRNRVDWAVEAQRSWESLADELGEAGSALCVVNLKRHARDLATLLNERCVPGLYHLSTNMCPAHRERVLAEVRRRLDEKLPCLLISTQCVEAGVDVDFPLVLRAFGPLEAIAQAAGRGNRNGLLPDLGLVRVFIPEDERYPQAAYENAASVTMVLFKELGPEAMNIDSPELFRRYYETFYRLTGATEGDRGRSKDLFQAIKTGDFVRTAELYRLIAEDTISVLVPYDLEQHRALKDELRGAGRLTREWIQQARLHAINLYRPKRDDVVWRYLDPAPLGRGTKSEDWFVYLEPDHYDRTLLGLKEASDSWIA